MQSTVSTLPTYTGGESQRQPQVSESNRQTSKIVSVKTYRIVNGVKTLISDETGERS